MIFFPPLSSESSPGEKTDMYNLFNLYTSQPVKDNHHKKVTVLEEICHKRVALNSLTQVCLSTIKIKHKTSQAMCQNIQKKVQQRGKSQVQLITVAMAHWVTDYWELLMLLIAPVLFLS